MSTLTVVAMGGHSLLEPGKPPTVANQFAVTERASGPIAELFARGERLLLTHGNGPQVGFMLLRSELAKRHLHEVPLDLLVANSQGSLGFMIQSSVRTALERAGHQAPVLAVVTEVEVDAQDPAFSAPDKPVGSHCSAAEAEVYQKERGWLMREEPGKGFRRVVPSPEPKRILQLDTLRTLLDSGVLVIAAGGGGVPCTCTSANASTRVEAVIDKDLTSSLLAIGLGAERLIITTAVDAIYLNHGSPNPEPLKQITAAELRRLQTQGHFPQGSMGPKVEAALRFVEGGGQQAIVCEPMAILAAVDGHAGTRIQRSF